MNGKLFLFVLLNFTHFVPLWGFAQTSNNSETTMSGYKFSDFAHFEKKWHLVTVRYRKDTGEMRFVYANDLAWNSLKNEKFPFPDGAQIGKIAYKTEEDPDFTSSLVPSSSKRYQFMVKDSKKHADTGGWGYALYTEEGKTFGGPQLSAQPCFACHTVDKYRDYVFSRPIAIPLNQKNTSQKQSKPPTFRTVHYSDLDPLIRQYLPATTTQTREMVGFKNGDIFAGTLDEVRPMLVKEALSANQPTYLIDRKEKIYSVVIIDRLSNECAKGTNKFRAYYSDPSGPDKVKKIEFCQ